MGIQLKGDLRKLSRKLEQLSRAELRRAGYQMREQLVSSTIRRFGEERAPDGTPWKPLSRATLEGSVTKRDVTKRGKLRVTAARRMAMRKILNQNARLKNGISGVVSGSRVHIGSNEDYANIHQFGGQAGRKSARVTIPARPFLGISKEDELEIARIVDKLVKP
jgi:phage virion morphogenesis protein